MPRSARRKSTPSSPAKSRPATTSPRQVRRSTRTQDYAPSNSAVKPTRSRQRQLAPVEEDLNDTIIVAAQVPSTNHIQHDGPTDHSETDQSSAPAESLSASSDTPPVNLDIDDIVDDVPRIDQDANDVLALVSSMPAAALIAELDDQHAKSTRRFRRFLDELQRHAQSCGVGPEKRLFFPNDTLRVLFTSLDSEAPNAEFIFQKANIVILLSVLLTGRALGEDQEPGYVLQWLALHDFFPQLFIKSSPNAEYSEGFRTRTQSFGVSMLTQSFILNAESSSGRPDFDPETLIQETFLDEEGDVRDVSLGMTSPKAEQELKRAVEQRIEEISNYTSQSADHAVDLAALQRKYPWKAFLVQAVGWTTSAAEYLEDAVADEGGTRSTKNALDRDMAAAVPIIPKSVKSKSSRKDSPNEDGATFMRVFDEDLEVEDDDDASQIESSRSQESQDDGVGAPQEEIQEVVQDDEFGDQPALQIPKSLRRQREGTVAESPQPESSQPATQRSNTVQASSHLAQRNTETLQEQQDEDDHEQVDVIGGSELLDHELSKPAQSPPAWTTQPTKKTQIIMALAQQQAWVSEKENSPPRQRFRLLDRQPNATKISFDDDDSQPQRQNPAKRSRRNDNNSDDDDGDFETDTRQAKRPRPDTGKAAAPRQTREQRSESGMSVADIDDPEDTPSERPSTQIAPRRHVPSHQSSAYTSCRPGPASTQPEPRRPDIATLGSSSRPPRSTTALDSVPPPSTYEAYAEVKKVAKRNQAFASLISSSAAGGGGGPRLPQVRRPWSVEEITRLIDLMNEYGTSWARIKQADENMVVPLLTHRGQVQLKDKARNMKLDFMKGEVPLPEYMENVTISKSHKEQLRRAGIGVPIDEAEEE